LFCSLSLSIVDYGFGLRFKIILEREESGKFFVTVHGIFYFFIEKLKREYLQINKCRDVMPCVSLFDQKFTDRDTKHCVSTLGLEILKAKDNFLGGLRGHWGHRGRSGLKSGINDSGDKIEKKSFF
jgi:hypothetical protein